MFSSWPDWLKIFLAAIVSFIVSYLFTPYAKKIATKFGAIDIPKDARRVHNHPIPRMGGLSIFLSVIVAVLLFEKPDKEIIGIIIGSLCIVIMGAIDDKYSLNPWIKLGVQVVASLIAINSGIVVDYMTFRVNGVATSVSLGVFALPITLIWIVGCTNAINLIDGLDGLAVGVSAISSVTMFVVASLLAEGDVALFLIILAAACLGFMPYNLNPAQIFMGDTGSQFLGFALATVSILGLFKFYAVFTFIVPFLALAVPLADTLFAFIRRISKGDSPFKPDRKHFHHRLLDMGLSQRQAVAVLCGVSAFFGVIAILLALGLFKVSIALALLIIIFVIVFSILASKPKNK